MIEIKNLTIQVEGFRKNYKDTIIQSGKITMISGQNGSGKTLLLNTICGLVKPESGIITIKDQNVQLDGWCHYTSVFLNKEFLIPYLSTNEYFTLCLKLSKKYTKENLNEIKNYSDKFNLSNSSTLIKKLSAGNMQKVGIISCLITNPDLIIWDEPFTHLDQSSLQILNNIMLDLSKKGKTILYSNHVNIDSYYDCTYAI